MGVAWCIGETALPGKGPEWALQGNREGGV